MLEGNAVIRLRTLCIVRWMFLVDFALDSVDVYEFSNAYPQFLLLDTPSIEPRAAQVLGQKLRNFCDKLITIGYHGLIAINHKKPFYSRDLDFARSPESCNHPYP